VRSKFVGGRCRQINEEWLRMLLEDKMSSTDFFYGYVRGKLALYKAWLIMVIKSLTWLWCKIQVADNRLKKIDEALVL
jgi:hypothetical protein